MAFGEDKEVGGLADHRAKRILAREFELLRRLYLLAGLTMLASGPARASELFGGVLAHDVDSPFTLGGREGGADF